MTTPERRRFRMGDRVVKDPANWQASEFDAWGAGEGVGTVVEVTDDAEAGDVVDVRWPGGRCYRLARELLPAPDGLTPASDAEAP